MLFLCYFFMSVSHPFMSASQNLLLYLRVTPALVYPRCSDFLAPCYGCVTVVLPVQALVLLAMFIPVLMTQRRFY